MFIRLLIGKIPSAIHKYDYKKLIDRQTFKKRKWSRPIYGNQKNNSDGQNQNCRRNITECYGIRPKAGKTESLQMPNIEQTENKKNQQINEI